MSSESKALEIYVQGFGFDDPPPTPPAAVPPPADIPPADGINPSTLLLPASVPVMVSGQDARRFRKLVSQPLTITYGGVTGDVSKLPSVIYAPAPGAAYELCAEDKVLLWWLKRFAFDKQQGTIPALGMRLIPILIQAEYIHETAPWLSADNADRYRLHGKGLVAVSGMSKFELSYAEVTAQAWEQYRVFSGNELGDMVAEAGRENAAGTAWLAKDRERRNRENGRYRVETPLNSHPVRRLGGVA